MVRGFSLVRGFAIGCLVIERSASDEAIQSFCFCRFLDCFAFARNDGEGAPGQVLRCDKLTRRAKFLFHRRANHFYESAHAVRWRGATRDRHGRGMGCGGRGYADNERRVMRTAKTCGPDAPTLASSRRKQFRRRRWQESPVAGESTI